MAAMTLAALPYLAACWGQGDGQRGGFAQMSVGIGAMSRRARLARLRLLFKVAGNYTKMRLPCVQNLHFQLLRVLQVYHYSCPVLANELSASTSSPALTAALQVRGRHLHPAPPGAEVLRLGPGRLRRAPGRVLGRLQHGEPPQSPYQLARDCRREMQCIRAQAHAR